MYCVWNGHGGEPPFRSELPFDPEEFALEHDAWVDSAIDIMWQIPNIGGVNVTWTDLQNMGVVDRNRLAQRLQHWREQTSAAIRRKRGLG